MNELKIFLLLSVVIVFIFVFYRWLKRYLHRNEILVPFSYLFPFDKAIFSGVEKIKLDLPESHTVRVEIFEATNMEQSHIAFEGRLNQGVSEIDIDLTPLKNGSYTFKVVFTDQSITRYIRVENSEIN